MLIHACVCLQAEHFKAAKPKVAVALCLLPATARGLHLDGHRSQHSCTAWSSELPFAVVTWCTVEQQAPISDICNCTYFSIALSCCDTLLRVQPGGELHVRLRAVLSPGKLTAYPGILLHLC